MDGMTKRLGFIALWLVATLASIAVGVQAVTSVRQQVADTPAPLESLAAQVTTTIVPSDGITTTTVPAAPTTTKPQTVTTTSPTTPTTTTAPPTTTAGGPTATSSSTTTSTTVPDTSTTVPPTTTTVAAETGEQFVSLQGGWVRISFAEDRLDLVGAAPEAGYDMEIEDDGPQQVEVEFTNGVHTSSFRARWNDGTLDIEQHEEDD
jgi:cytoskeletal protein RodZ